MSKDLVVGHGSSRALSPEERAEVARQFSGKAGDAAVKELQIRADERAKVIAEIRGKIPQAVYDATFRAYTWQLPHTDPVVIEEILKDGISYRAKITEFLLDALLGKETT